METLSQLQLVNEYMFLARDCQEKDKFIQACSTALHHCQCGVVSQKLIEDLTYIVNKINSEEYKNLFYKTSVSPEYQIEQAQGDSTNKTVEVKTTLLSTGEIQYEVVESQGQVDQHVSIADDEQQINSRDTGERQDDTVDNQAPVEQNVAIANDEQQGYSTDTVEIQYEAAAEQNVTVTDIEEQDQFEGEYTALDVTDTGDLTVLKEEQVIRTISLPPYPGTSTTDVTSTTLDTSECVIDASGEEVTSAMASLGTVAIVTEENGNVVVYEQLDDDGQMIVVTSEQVNLSDEVDEISVLAETASQQPPISDSVIEAEDVTRVNKSFNFATEEEERELMQKITTPVQVKVIENPDKVFKCYVCDKAFSKQFNLRDHMITHDKTKKEKYKCEICGRGFPKPYQVKAHMETHEKLKPFQCGVCGKKFAQKGSQNRHMKIHTKEKPYACSICDKRFNQFGHAKVHMAMHSEMRHKCHLCPRTFHSLDKLTRHLSLHEKLAKKKPSEFLSEKPLYFNEVYPKDSGSLKYACKYCPERLATTSDLKAHDESHAVDRPYQCDICGLRCIKEKNLKFHRNSHSRNAKHVCEVCGRKFRSLFWLENHLQQHNGIKPFMCEDCGAVFTLQCTLTRHRVREHNDQPNRNCKTCGQHFPSFKALKDHRAKFHVIDKKRYHCKKCGEKFSTISTLVKHHRTHLEASPCGSDVEVKEECGEDSGESDTKPDDLTPCVEKKATKPIVRTSARKRKGKTVDHDDSAPAKTTDQMSKQEVKDKFPDYSSIETVTDKNGKIKKACPLCGALLHPSSIYKHIQFHDSPRISKNPFTKTGQKRKPCSVCNKYISETSVFTHMRIHKKKGDIPAEPVHKDDGKYREACDICGKLCTPTSLTRHKKTHLPERPYSCDICGKRFNQKPHVARHKRSQHPGK